MTEKTHNEELNEKKATKVPVDANNYIISIRRLSLGEYSCLIVGIILALLGLYSLYLYFQKKKDEKAGK